MDEPHAAIGLGEARRTEYLVAVAAMVYADRKIADSEWELLQRLGSALALPRARVQEVEAAALAPDMDRVDGIVRSFRADPCRFALLTDAILVAYADDRVAKGEPELLARFAATLDVPRAAAVLLGRYVEQLIAADQPSGKDKELSEALAAGLEEANPRVHSPNSIRRLFRKLVQK